MYSTEFMLSYVSFQLALTDVRLCSWSSSQLHNAADSEWIFGLCFVAARHLLACAASVYATATDAAFLISHKVRK